MVESARPRDEQELRGQLSTGAAPRPVADHFEAVGASSKDNRYLASFSTYVQEISGDRENIVLSLALSEHKLLA